jgi:eukaryotic-like serine/threonine-protein kinase
MTSPDRHARVKDLLLAAAERPLGERADFLAEACGGDEGLRVEIESLLRHLDGDATPFRLDAPSPATRPDEEVPERIGHYRLIQKLGEGGMGVVYEAEQESPVRRRVALKLVKWGMDSKEVLARFESERQALALMAHPNIAQVYEVGATPTGRPFFAMEFVKGSPIHEYCDANCLSTEERLQLFLEVCNGVQHAHHKGVIHRDMKPSNVLVTVEDGGPVPKIIDFGVAKATAQRLTEMSVFTQLGQWIGTPEYMSPEQAEMSPLGVDTRTDVYSLGVMLYELLSGALPFDAAELRATDFDEMRRRIREQEPLRPSTRVSRLGKASELAAGRRRTDSRTLIRLLRGDLDWITMKALEKDRTRRYGSPAELAADVERHLRSEPVLAGPPSGAYRVRKFVRRHRVGVAAAVTVLAALVAGIVGTTIGLVRAEREARAARQITSVLMGVFEGLAPESVRGPTLTPGRMLDRGVQGIRKGLAGQPRAQARLLATVASVYRSLGTPQEARPLLEEALDLLNKEVGEKSPETALVLEQLAWAEDDLGNVAEARRLADRAAMLLDKAPAEYEDAFAAALRTAALFTATSGEPAIAWPLFARAAEIQQRLHGPRSLDLATTLSFEGLARSWFWDLDAAGDRLERAHALLEGAVEPDHVGLAQLRVNLARVLRQNGDAPRAREMAERGAGSLERALGPDHLGVAVAYWELANCLAQTGATERAEPLFDRAIRIQERTLGADHPELAHTLFFKAGFLLRMGRPREARALFERCLAIREKAFGSDGHWIAWAHDGLGQSLVATDDRQRARAHYEKAVAVMERATGPESPALVPLLGNLGSLLVRMGDHDTGLAHLRRGAAISEKVRGPESWMAAVSLNRLGVNLNVAGRSKEAREVFERVAGAGGVADERFRRVREAAVYNIACTEALMGNRSQALAVLSALVRDGFAREILLNDPDLASLRSDREYEAMKATVRGRIAEQRRAATGGAPSSATGPSVPQAPRD